MWFKNLRLYRLTAPFDLSAEELHERLTPQAFRPCGTLAFSSYGWVPPLGRNGSMLSHTANGCHMICARKEEKILPTSMINELVSEKAADIEDQQMRKIRRKERENIRDEIIHQLLPQAFTRSNLTYAYIAPHDHWLVIDSSSLPKAESLLDLLRHSLGTLAVVPPAVQVSPEAMLTRWLGGKDVPPEIVLKDECELRDPVEEGSSIRCKRQDLAADEIQAHLEAGKRAVKLAIAWRERLLAVIGDDLSVKRLRFEDIVQEEAGAAEDGDEAARFDADFALMTLELKEFIGHLMGFFGGEDDRAYRRDVAAA